MRFQRAAFGVLLVMFMASCNEQSSQLSQDPAPADASQIMDSDGPLLLSPLPSEARPAFDSHNVEFEFSLQRLERPWRGPVVDLLGLTLPLQVGDVDQDGLNEVIVNLRLLDERALPVKAEGTEETLCYDVISTFGWDGFAYAPDQALCVGHERYDYPLSLANSMAVVTWGDGPILAVGTSPWRTNRYGSLSFVDATGTATRLLWETICLGAVYRLEAVEIAGVDLVAASTWSNYVGILPQPDLEACPTYDDMVQGGEGSRALVLIGKTGDQFSTKVFPAGTSDTLLVGQLPDASGEVYWLSADWTADSPSVTVKMWQEDAFVPVDGFWDYRDGRVLAVEPADLDGDGVRELAMLWRPDARVDGVTRKVPDLSLRDVHLDIYRWGEGSYRLEWRHLLERPVRGLAVGDLDHDGDSEIVTDQGLIVDRSAGHYVTSEALTEYISQLELWPDSGESTADDMRFLIADADNDQKDELVMIARVRHEALPPDIRDYVWEHYLEMPAEGVFYVYVIEVVRS